MTNETVFERQTGKRKFHAETTDKCPGGLGIGFSWGEYPESMIPYVLTEDEAIDLARWIAEWYGVDIVLHPKVTFVSTAQKVKVP